MDFFRSEEMSRCRFYAQSVAAFEIVSNLGDFGIASFIDLNGDKNSFQRPFMSEIMRCEAINSNIQALKTQLMHYGIEPKQPTLEQLRPPNYKDFHKLELLVDSSFKDFSTLNQNYKLILPQLSLTSEHCYTIKMFDQMFSSLDLSLIQCFNELNIVDDDFQFQFITGIIRADKLLNFERVLWRFFGSNIFTRIFHPDQPIGVVEPLQKKIFIICFKGANIKQKLVKICNSFSAQLYDIPDGVSKRETQIKALTEKCADLELVMKKSNDFIHRLLSKIADEILSWEILLFKFRAVFYNLNKLNFDSFYKCLQAEIWCTTKQRHRLSSLTADISERYFSPVIFEPSIHVESNSEKPTHFRVNKFTRGFQNIVDSYGVANYQEINPSPFTIITFPFLFAVMFGDAGHGLIIALFAIWMILYEKKFMASSTKNDIWFMFFGGRYIILLMGLFAIYTGLMYNDIFSKSINIFGSSFHAPMSNVTDINLFNYSGSLDPATQYSQTPYPFGIDPIWQLSNNKIVFLNTYKMKLSVILGVLQMFFGVVLSLFNHLHFRRYENIVFEFIPQIIFLLSIFGYMNILIFVKWFKYSSADSGDAPSILINLINMFLMKYPTDGPKYLQSWYPGQQVLQTFLLCCAIICVPWILFPKVFYLRHQSKKTHADVENPDVNHFEFGDALINQAIHTIEYCLGSVSHTASYLRLWALSLAHSQLSEVLWKMVMRPALACDFSSSYLNGIFAASCFLFWAILSVAVLIIMEGLSAFLHSLRLHWVEFQSKFYTGSGVKFEPFDFHQILLENGLEGL